jgi:hypothetical protein
MLRLFLQVCSEFFCAAYMRRLKRIYFWERRCRSPNHAADAVLLSVGSALIANYPALDLTPPTNSPEVQAWIQQVQNSGIPIPNIAPAVAGGCASNPERVTNSTSIVSISFVFIFLTQTPSSLYLLVDLWSMHSRERYHYLPRQAHLGFEVCRPMDTDCQPDANICSASFDDGPSPDTPRLLQYLNQNNLKSTFFVVGSRALSRQDILQAEYTEGHQLSVHSALPH